MNTHVKRSIKKNPQFSDSNDNVEGITFLKKKSLKKKPTFYEQ